MPVIGALDFAAALARLGSFPGCPVTVCDTRPVFATVSGFPQADEVVARGRHYLANRSAPRHRCPP